jgi:hypothetical protein
MTPFEEAGDWYQGRLGMGAIIRIGGKIQLGLDVDFDALVRALFLNRALRRAGPGTFLLFVQVDFVSLGEIIRMRGRQRKRQAGLGIVRARTATPHTVGFQTAGDFSAPFRFGGVCCLVGYDGRGYTHRNRFEIFVGIDEWSITKRTIVSGLKQQGATM